MSLKSYRNDIVVLLSDLRIFFFFQDRRVDFQFIRCGAYMGAVGAFIHGCDANKK